MTISAPPALRWYQEEAVDAVFAFLQQYEGNPLIVLPTGAGKSLVISAIIEKARSNAPLRVCVLATQAELVKQNSRAAGLLNDPALIGIYSASLGLKDAMRPITVANIQSLAKQAYAFEPFDLILVDEAHTIADADSGQYRQFLTAQRQQNPAVVVIGLTATPYKLSSGLLTEGPTALFSAVAYEAPILKLIEEGFLTRPITPRATTHIDTSAITLRGGEFMPKALSDAVDVDHITQQCCDEIVLRFQDRHHWLIFAVSIDHSRHIAQALSDRGVKTAVVHGELERDERAYRLNAFHTGEVQALVNCQLLTTGWDEPQVDAIALLRPTKSAGLYTQMIGRGMRVHPSKTDCLILDFARLVEQFGPVDAIQLPGKSKSTKTGSPPAKLCPVCEHYLACSLRHCPGCGHEFPPPAVDLSPIASQGRILSTDPLPMTWTDITSVSYQHNPPKPPKTLATLRVEYYAGYRCVAREWVCIEHEGYARKKAEQWWARRSGDLCPTSLETALELAEQLEQPTAIATTPDPANPKYTRIVDYRFPHEARADSGLPRACWTCGHWANRCTKWDAVPPQAIQDAGCDDWTDEEEMPF